MSEFHALMWNVKLGTEDQVRELFKNYGRPDPTIRDDDGNEVGKLLGTQVFLKGNTVVRVVEVEGSLREVAVHMGKQPAVRDLEEKLDDLLETPRDMSTPQGAAAFFRQSAMEVLIARKAGE